MKSFDAMRRELLRTGGFGVAGAAIPSMTFAAATPPAGESGTALQGIFDVRKYGTTGDGKTLDTDAINRAIEAAAAAGGGKENKPAGDYLCFSIHLKSQVHLY